MYLLSIIALQITPKFSNLRHNIYSLIWFLRVMNLVAAYLGGSNSGSPWGCSHTVGQNYSLLKAWLGLKNALPSSWTWLLADPVPLLAVGCELQFLVTWASPQGGLMSWQPASSRVMREREREGGRREGVRRERREGGNKAHKTRATVFYYPDTKVTIPSVANKIVASKDVHALILRTCEYAISMAKELCTWE